ncbi:hypothetical protein BGY98DRAFT_58871 [Russula aff. rugulosa BPL654]|nr:hypothetical protein BGY98DRAFT_58871 [Russula aff. rugulosa BPL654]
MFQVKLRSPEDSAAALLDPLFRVRTTLLRKAFSLSSLSRRASSSGSRETSVFCAASPDSILFLCRSASAWPLILIPEVGPFGELRSRALPLPSSWDLRGLGLLVQLLLLLGGLLALLPFSASLLLLLLLRPPRSLSPLLLRGGDRELERERSLRLRRGLALRLRRVWSGLRLGVRPRAGGLVRLRRAGGLRLSRPLPLRSRSCSRGEYDGERRRRRR